MSQNGLERFPDHETAKRMLRSISPIYENSRVAKWLFQVMGAELEEARQFFESLRLQAFPETADWGLVYWEQRYGIPADPERALGARRQEVLIRRGIRAPMNPARLEAVVSAMAGLPVIVTENIAPYAFRVSIFGDSAADYAEIAALIRRVKPSHQRAELVAVPGTIRFRNKYTTHLSRLCVDMRFQNQRGNPILLNGQRCLDGSWTLSHSYLGIALHSVT